MKGPRQAPEPGGCGPRRLWSRQLACALAVIGAGYGLLAVPPAEGIASRTAAPALLVLGYCILVPAAILRRHARDDATGPTAQG